MAPPSTATAQDVMAAAPPMASSLAAKHDVLAMVAASLCDTVAIVDERHVLIGEISRERLQPSVIDELVNDDVTAHALMTQHPLTCDLSTTLAELAMLLGDGTSHRPLFVLDPDGYPRGVITPARLAELLGETEIPSVPQKSPLAA
jgi:CBS domain-containing protein